MKLKKLLSVITATALSLTMCLSTSIFASAEGETVDAGTYYDLQKALDNANVSVINITGDIGDEGSITVELDKETTINFNGYTVHNRLILRNSSSLILNGGTLIGNDNGRGDSAITMNDNSSVKANNMKLIGGDATEEDNSGGESVYLYDGTAEFDNCYFSTGKSTNGGGSNALCTQSNKMVKVKNCTFEQYETNDTSYVLIDGTIYDFDGNAISISSSENRARKYNVGFGYDANILDGNIATDTDGSPAIVETPVSANATIPEPTYTVVIPATVDMKDMAQILPKYRDNTIAPDGEDVVKTVDFEVYALNVDNLFDDLGKKPQLDLSVSYDGKMTGEKDTAATLPYTISKGETAIEINTNTVVTSFKNTSQLAEGEKNSVTLTASVNRADITAADNFAGILTFTVSIPDDDVA